MSASSASRDTRTPRERSRSAMSLSGIVGLQVMGDHVAVRDMGAEVDVEGNGALGGTTALLAEHGERAGVVGATGNRLARRGAEDLDPVEVKQMRGPRDHEADVASCRDPALEQDVEAGDRGAEPVTPLGLARGALVLEQLGAMRGRLDKLSSSPAAGVVGDLLLAVEQPYRRVAGRERQRLVAVDGGR